MTIIEQIRKELFDLNQKYIDEAEDNYDFGTITLSMW